MVISTSKVMESWQLRAAELNEEARRYWRNAPETAIKRALAVEELVNTNAVDESEWLLAAESRVHQANAMVALGELRNGLELAKSAESLARRVDSKQAQATAFGAMARAYEGLTNLPKALDAAQKQLMLGLESDDLTNVKTASVALGAIYVSGKNYEAAVEQLEKSVTLFDDPSPEEKVTLSGCYNGLCVAFGDMEEYAKGVAYGQKGLELTESGSLPHIILLLSMAYNYRHDKQFDRSFVLCERAIALLEQSPHTYHRAAALANLAHTHYGMGNFTAAQEIALQALAFAIETNSAAQQAGIYELLSQLAEERGEFQDALKHHKTFYDIQQSVLGEESRRQQRLLRVSYEVDVAQLQTDLYRARTEELEKEVQHRTIDLQHALDRERVLGSQLSDALQQSQAANELRSRIINTVSHEFRTPLTIINTTSELLTKYSRSLPETKKDKLHGRIKTSVMTITDLLEEVVLVESVDAKSLEPIYQKCSFNEVVHQLEQHLHHAFADQIGRLQITTHGDTQRTLRTDNQLLCQIVHQVVSNALKYSEPDEPVSIHVAVGDQGLTLEVIDHGVGIVAEDKDKIFGLFYRGSNISTTIAGLGLGLYIAQSLAREMGGEISAESHPSSTVFKLQLSM